MGGYEIQRRPWRIPEDIHPVGDRKLDLLNVALQIVDAVIIVNLTVFIQRIKRAQPIFLNDQR